MSGKEWKRKSDYSVTHQRVNVAVHPSDHTIVPRFLQAEVGLLCVVGHLVVVVVGGVLVEHLKVGAGTDLRNFGIRCVTEALKGGSKRDMNENSEEEDLWRVIYPFLFCQNRVNIFASRYGNYSRFSRTPLLQRLFM